MSLLEKGFRNYGEIFSLRMLHVPIYVISNPEWIRQVLVEGTQTYVRARMVDQLRVLLGDGLVTSDGDKWRVHRKLMQPAFHLQRIQGFFDGMVRNTESLISKWEDASSRGEVIDASHDFMKLTLRIVSQSLFGFDTGSRADEISEAVDWILPNALLRLESFFPLLRAIPTRANLEFRRRQRELNQVIYEIIRERREGPPGRPQERQDLLQMLIDATEEDEKGGKSFRMSDQALRDEVMTLFMAGHETTANALSWTVHLLTQHPEIEKKLREEIQRVLGNEPLTLEKLKLLTYTRQVLEESMRIRPPVWTIARTAVRDTELGGYFVPKGTVLSTSIYLTHRNPRLWKDPEKFDPDRFSEENRKTHPRGAYFPFGAGPHTCIGNQFAMMEAQTILALIYRRFSLEGANEGPVGSLVTITLRPQPGIRVRAR